jgi:MazG family protein
VRKTLTQLATGIVDLAEGDGGVGRGSGDPPPSANLKFLHMSEEKLPPGAGLERLVEIMARLRAPDGCPWDREQTYDTIKRYLLEESYEVMDAVDQRDWSGLAEELGDLMLQAVFFAQMAAEEGRFDISDSLYAINSKLVRRHPHVFGDGDAKTADDVTRRWDEIKAEEKKEKEDKKDKAEKPKGLLEGVPRSLPALVEASQIASRAARAGFDWQNVDQVFDKMREELDELAEARASQTQDKIEDEMGDLLFVVVNIARYLKVDPEQALRRTNAKFRRRFGQVESGLRVQGKEFSSATIDEMESLWQAAKQQESATQKEGESRS